MCLPNVLSNFYYLPNSVVPNWICDTTVCNTDDVNYWSFTLHFADGPFVGRVSRSPAHSSIYKLVTNFGL